MKNENLPNDVRIPFDFKYYPKQNLEYLKDFNSLEIQARVQCVPPGASHDDVTWDGEYIIRDKDGNPIAKTSDELIARFILNSRKDIEDLMLVTNELSRALDDCLNFIEQKTGPHLEYHLERIKRASSLSLVLYFGYDRMEKEKEK